MDGIKDCDNINPNDTKSKSILKIMISLYVTRT